MGESEFGKGLAVCLVKFAEHRLMHDADSFQIYNKFIEASEEDRKKMISLNPPDKLNYGFPHMQRLKHFVETADKIYNGDYKKKLSFDIEVFMNAASDHLYEIEVPEGKEWDEIREMVENLRSRALMIGHGFREGICEKKVWDLNDVEGLFELTREIAFQLDKMIGLNPNMGTW